MGGEKQHPLVAGLEFTASPPGGRGKCFTSFYQLPPPVSWTLSAPLRWEYSGSERWELGIELIC